MVVGPRGGETSLLARKKGKGRSKGKRAAINSGDLHGDKFWSSSSPLAGGAVDRFSKKAWDENPSNLS